MTMVRIKLLATLLVFSLVFFLAACDDAPPNTKQAKPSVVKKKIAPLPPSMVKPVKPTVSQSQAMPVKNKAASKVTNIDKKESVSVKKVKDTNPEGSAQNISKKDSIDTASEKKTLARLGITNNDETKHYQSQGKIDPFRPLIQETTDDAEVVKANKPKRILTPLEKIALSQIRLVAVIQTTKKNIAMVEEASGKGYEVTEGTYIGKKQGRIIEIKSDRIVVKELVKDYKGRLKEQIQEIKLNKNSDGE